MTDGKDEDTITVRNASVRRELQEMRKILASKLQAIDQALANINAVDSVTQFPTEATGTLEELITQTVRMSPKPLSSREIASIIQAVRPVELPVIRSILTRMHAMRRILKEGERGNYRYFLKA